MAHESGCAGDGGIRMDRLLDTVLGTIKSVADRLSARIDALEKREPVPGRDGRDGQPGAKGEKGDPGEPGKDGSDGIDGIGEVGPMGPAGPEGARGLQGEKGIDGRDGLPGRDGVSGPAGEKGIDGKDGAPGRDGKDGRDAIVGNVKMERVSERVARFVWMDGTPIEGGEMKFSHPFYRDVFTTSREYEAGDVVQRDGSGWIALVDNPKGIPGVGKPEVTGWKLFIKRGDVGKAGPKGDQGERGMKGDPGPQGRSGY